MTTPEPSGTVVSTSPFMLGGERRRLARALAEAVVTEVAAGELPLFERRARSHFRPRLWSRRPLSVDVWGLATDSVTPAALSAAAGVLGVMSAELVSRLTSRVVGRVARRGRRAEVEPAEPQAPPTPAPSAAELARFRAAALAGAERHMTGQQAELVADSVLAALVRMLASDTAGNPGGDSGGDAEAGAGGEGAGDGDGDGPAAIGG